MIHERWLALYRVEVEAPEAGSDPVQTVRRELTLEAPPPVAEQALRAMDVRKFRELALPALLLFEHPEENIRERTRNVLWGLTGHNLPFDPHASEEVRLEQQQAWREVLEKE